MITVRSAGGQMRVLEHQNSNRGTKMKIAYTVMVLFLLPITAFADGRDVPAISSTCVVRSSPAGRDGSTVEYTWKIMAEAKEQRVMSVAVSYTHLTLPTTSP